jgi:hypothetical protein
MAAALNECHYELEQRAAIAPLLPVEKFSNHINHGPLWMGIGVLVGTTAGATAGISAMEREWRGVAVSGGLLVAVGVGLILWLYLDLDTEKSVRIQHSDLL